MKAAALRGALSDRARAGSVHVLSALVDGRHPVDQDGAQVRSSAVADAEATCWWCSAADDEVGWLSLRNVPEVHLIAPDQLNTYDVLVSDDVVFTRAALDEFLGQRRSRRRPGAAAARSAGEVRGCRAGAAGRRSSRGVPVKGSRAKLYHVPGSRLRPHEAEVWSPPPRRRGRRRADADARRRSAK